MSDDGQHPVGGSPVVPGDPSAQTPAAPPSLADKLGVCQWFHYQDYPAVERAVALAEELGVRHLRTGVSWADFHRPEGEAWYDWQMKALDGFEVLLSVWHTPPSRAQGEVCAGPPRRLEDYDDFLAQLIVWITETGLATCDVHDGTPMRHDLQVECLQRAAAAPAERVCWYSLEDLACTRSTRRPGRNPRAKSTRCTPRSTSQPPPERCRS